MAGAGRRLYVPGDVMGVAEGGLQDYLMDQKIMNFAVGGTAAAGSALGTAVAEGMIVYAGTATSEGPGLFFFDGSEWQEI